MKLQIFNNGPKGGLVASLFLENDCINIPVSDYLIKNWDDATKLIKALHKKPKLSIINALVKERNKILDDKSLYFKSGHVGYHCTGERVYVVLYMPLDNSAYLLTSHKKSKKVFVSNNLKMRKSYSSRKIEKNSIYNTEPRALKELKKRTRMEYKTQEEKNKQAELMRNEISK